MPAEPLVLPNPIPCWALAAMPRPASTLSLSGETGSLTARVTIPRDEARAYARGQHCGRPEIGLSGRGRRRCGAR